MAQAATVSGPASHAAEGQQTFDSQVERWRPTSARAAQTTQQVTGVQLESDLLLALVAVESDGQPDARSAAGAVGLVQVEPATFADLQRRYHALLTGEALDEPETNVLAGALYLADCARLLHADITDPGDLSLVLYAYNLGPRAALEWRQTGVWTVQAQRGVQVRHDLPVETMDHARRIMSPAREPGTGT